ncbi:glycoside hydrolase family 79 protein [Xylaria nigripes]|nr:glycoside hydrolase family 79 protein [Xylaria nigripes]
MAGYRRPSARHAITWLILFGPRMVLSEDTDSVEISLPAAPPDGTSGRVSPSFVGFGIEPSNLYSFMGHESPNQLTNNLIANLATYAGAPPHIRIGGHTQDFMVYDPQMTQWDVINMTTTQDQGVVLTDSLHYGPQFFQAANRLPTGTPVTWGLNLAYNGSGFLDGLVTVASLALDQAPNIKITGFELGDDPSHYGINKFRDLASWNGHEYVKEWQYCTATLWLKALLPRNFSAGAFEAVTVPFRYDGDYEVGDLATYGIAAMSPDTGLPPGTVLFSEWSSHHYYHYIGVTGAPYVKLADMLHLDSTEVAFQAWTEQIQQARRTPYPFALREVGIVGPDGLQGITDVFGAALWTLNFLLYTASLGVESVQLHMIDTSIGSAWQPIEISGQKPFVRPLYYGVAAFDQVIGDAGCGARVWQYPLSGVLMPTEYNGCLKAYAVYEANALRSIVVINGRESNVSVAEGDKLRVSVKLKLPISLADHKIHMAYLTGDGADATRNTTWNGISFEMTDDGMPTKVSDTQDTLQVGKDGIVNLSVRDSQAVVGTIGRRTGLGSECTGAGTVTSNGRGGEDMTATPQEQPTISPYPSPQSLAHPAMIYQPNALLFEVSLTLLIRMLLF